ncbi:DUF3124 domain-containing protein [Ilyomonas limi]|uniref:DUF3124 domain-containing protein n=2 Tax=Ilyomonas limi TaxID=2575867 RepID=A0A4U3LA86_9BACT|nr:DUF3124 domain-containing protein [Ilyomonas limi]
MYMAIIKLFLLASTLLLFSCRNSGENNIRLPSQEYHYVALDTAKFTVEKAIYVPIYSHIYLNTGNRAFNLTATMSIRNISYTDSFYIKKIIYYGSKGEELKKYIDSTLLLKPMASYEFVVEHDESKGGAGANFVVSWAAKNNKTEPLIEAVMVGDYNGMSFITQGVEIKQ